MIVRVISTAQTGYFYTTQRLRQGPKLSAVKYDPKGALYLNILEFGFTELFSDTALISKIARPLRRE